MAESRKQYYSRAYTQTKLENVLRTQAEAKEELEQAYTDKAELREQEMKLLRDILNNLDDELSKVGDQMAELKKLTAGMSDKDAADAWDKLHQRRLTRRGQDQDLSQGNAGRRLAASGMAAKEYQPSDAAAPAFEQAIAKASSFGTGSERLAVLDRDLGIRAVLNKGTEGEQLAARVAFSEKMAGLGFAASEIDSSLRGHTGGAHGALDSDRSTLEAKAKARAEELLKTGVAGVGKMGTDEADIEQEKAIRGKAAREQEEKLADPAYKRIFADLRDNGIVDDAELQKIFLEKYADDDKLNYAQRYGVLTLQRAETKAKLDEAASRKIDAPTVDDIRARTRQLAKPMSGQSSSTYDAHKANIAELNREKAKAKYEALPPEKKTLWDAGVAAQKFLRENQNEIPSQDAKSLAYQSAKAIYDGMKKGQVAGRDIMGLIDADSAVIGTPDSEEAKSHRDEILKYISVFRLQASRGKGPSEPKQEQVAPKVGKRPVDTAALKAYKANKEYPTEDKDLPESE